MISPTKLGFALIALIFWLYLASMQTQSGILFLILGILVGCFLINILKSRNSVKNLQLLPPKAILTSENESFRDAWKIHNTSAKILGQIEVMAPWGTLMRIAAVPPLNTVHITPALRFQVRGVYPFSSLRLRSSFPYGLVRCERSVRQSGEIIVTPFVYPCNLPLAAGFEPMLGGGFSGGYASRTGEQFHGIRPFTPHDPLKMIHWPSTSKGQGIMVKEFDEELSGRVAIIMACREGHRYSRETTLDWAARAGGSLLLAALDAGYHVEFVSLTDDRVVLVPPFADGQSVLEGLARLTPLKDAVNDDKIVDVVNKLSQKAGLSFILTAIDDDIIRPIINLQHPGHRRIAVYLPKYLADSTGAFGTMPVHLYGRDGID